MCGDGGAEAGDADAAAEPDFAVVCSFLALAGDACAIEPVPFPKLLAYLHNPDEVPTYLVELFCKLLRRAVKSFRPNNWEKYLIKFCNQRGHRQDAWELERFGYKKSNVRVKLRVLKNLLEHQFVCNTKFKNAINKMDNRQLRLNPLGRDDKGRCYWLQMDHRANLRLYREDQDEETWKLIANDRAGLIEITNALKSGKYLSDSIAEPVLNEDSNSVESPCMPAIQAEETDTDNKESSPLSSVKPSMEVDDDIPKNDSDSPKTNTGIIEKDAEVREASIDTESQANDNGSTVTESIKNISESGEDSTLSVDCKIDNKTNDADNQDDIVGEEIEESVMIIKGDGNGADCEAMPNYFFSEEIEEDVMYVFGEGYGYECNTGNPGVDTASSNVPEAQNSESTIDNGEESSTSDSNRAENVLNSKNGDLVDNVSIETDVKCVEESDLEAKGGPSAPLPVTKRFLQNIPKPQTLNTDSNSPSKIKLWSVDSFCTSSNNDNCANKEAVLEDSTRTTHDESADVSLNDKVNETAELTNNESDVHSQSITDSDLVKCDNNAIASSEYNAAKESSQKEDEVSEANNLREATNLDVKSVEDCSKTAMLGELQSSTDCIESSVDNDQSNNVEEHKIDEPVDLNVNKSKENSNIDEDLDKSDIETTECQENTIKNEKEKVVEESRQNDVKSKENIVDSEKYNNEEMSVESQKLETEEETLVEENVIVEDKIQEKCIDSEEKNIKDEHNVEDLNQESIVKKISIDNESQNTIEEHNVEELHQESTVKKISIDNESQNTIEEPIVEYSASIKCKKQDEVEESIKLEDQEKSEIENHNAKEDSIKVEFKGGETITESEKYDAGMDSQKKDELKNEEAEVVKKAVSESKITEDEFGLNANKTETVIENFANMETQDIVLENVKGKVVDKLIDETSMNIENDTEGKPERIEKSVDIESSIRENAQNDEADEEKSPIADNNSKGKIKRGKHKAKKEPVVEEALNIVNNGEENVISSVNDKAEIVPIDESINLETNSKIKIRGGKPKGKEDAVVEESTSLRSGKERNLKSKKSKTQVESVDEELTNTKADDSIKEKVKSGKHKAIEDSSSKKSKMQVESVHEELKNTKADDGIKEKVKSGKHKAIEDSSDAVDADSELINNVKKAKMEDVENNQEESNVIIEASKSGGENSNLKAEGKIKREECNSQSDDSGISMKKIKTDVQEDSKKIVDKVIVKDAKVETMVVTVQLNKLDIEMETKSGMRTRRSGALKNAKLSEVVKESEVKLEKLSFKGGRRTRGAEKNAIIEKLKAVKKEEVVEKKADKVEKEVVEKKADKVEKEVIEKKADKVEKEEGKNERVTRKRGRDKTESESEEEVLEVPKSKKVKMRQKKVNTVVRKKVEEKKMAEESSDEDEPVIPIKGNAKNTLNPKADSPPENTEKKVAKKKGRKKKVKGSKVVEAEQVVDDTPVRQSRRIAQLKIKEEAQRRHMEEMALREMKEQHKKKNNKSKDQDWENEASEPSSEDAKEAIKIKGKKKHKKLDNWHKKQLGWNSSSGGNDSDSEPGNEPEDDFDEQEEEDILAPKSDHEFSPESDVESSDVVPVRRARTLKKDDGEVLEDNDNGCTQCGKNDHPEWILLCDSCDAGWHASCLKPVLFLVPEGEWFCPPCNHKSLIAALDGALDDYDKLVERVKDEDLEKKMKSDESADNASEYNSDNDSDDDNSEANSESNSSSESSDDEKIYRLRERRQLPVSYRFKEYDQLISSAIKEEYKEVDNSGAGNMGRGKDISTIIEADLEEKKAMAEAIKETGDETVPRPRQPKARRRPRKLNSLEVVSDDCDDNSDEDFKETACSTSSSEAISSNESANSSSSRSSDSLPIRRSSRPTKSKLARRKTPERKKKRRRIIESDDDDENSASDASSSKEWETRKKKSARRSRKREPGSSRRRKKEKKEGDDDDDDDIKPVKQRAKVKYGGLSDSSRSSHDWSPAHRTRQKKYNYMEMPNTESEEEAHKPSGKHMDSSDEYKGESDSGSDSESSGNKKKRFFDEDFQNMQTDKEAYQKDLESQEAKSSQVPIAKLNDLSPVKTDGALQTDINVQTNEETISTTDIPTTIAAAVETTPLKFIGIPNRFTKRGGKSGGSPRKNFKKVIDMSSLKEGDPVPGEGTVIGGDGEALNIPIKCVIMTPFQIEREKKRKEKEEKMKEKEIRKEERLKKKEEKLMVKEQKAKEREEKKIAKQASMEQRCIARKVIRPEYQPGQQIFTNPIPIMRGPGVFPQIRQPYPPHMGPGGPNIRGPMPPNMNQPHMNIRPYMQGAPPREGPPPLVHMDNRDQIIHHRPLIDTQIKSERADTDESQGYSPHPEDRKSMIMLDKPQLINLETRKPFPGGPRPHLESMRGMSPNMDNQSSVIRPPMPGYPMDDRGIPIMRSNIRPNENHNDMVSRNGIPISDMQPEHRQSPHLGLNSEDAMAKRRGRGPGKKTLARQSNLSTDGSSPSPSSSPIIEGTLAVAGAPQPFRPNVDPPSVITRMPHIMPPPYRGSSVYNNSIPMYGAPRMPPNHLMGGSFRPHHPHPLDPSPSGGGPISMASPDRSSPQSYSPYPPQSYYPPGSTPPQLGPFPPPHGRFPPHLNAPPSRSPTPQNTPESTEEVKSKASDTPEPVPFIKSEIKEEPNTDKQSSSPTEELEAASEKSAESEQSAASPPPAARPVHPRLKHTENKSRGRISLTTAARYPQGPYAPQYGPYAPPHHPPSSEASYLHPNLHPIHLNHPQPHMSQIHRPIYPSPHMTPIQLTPRPPAAQAVRPDEAPNPTPSAAGAPPPTTTTGEDEPSEFGGLVSYFSSQREDDIDT